MSVEDAITRTVRSWATDLKDVSPKLDDHYYLSFDVERGVFHDRSRREREAYSLRSIACGIRANEELSTAIHTTYCAVGVEHAVTLVASWVENHPFNALTGEHENRTATPPSNVTENDT